MLQNFVPKNGRRLFGTQNLPYVILNVGKLNEDMKEKYYRKGSKLREEYGSIGRTLIINGVNDSVITNARASYRAYKELIHAACDIPEGADPGRMREDYYKCILKAFRLKDVYVYPPTQEYLDAVANDMVEQSPQPKNDDEILKAIEEQTKINDGILAALREISDTLKSMDESWKAPKTYTKPVAIVKPNKEDVANG